jgi:ABC-type lipoprotein export system ATPase subunit
MPHSAVSISARSAQTLRLADVLVARGAGADTARILDVERLELAAGASLGLSGPSGAGKSTLLNLVAGLLRPQRGAVTWGDRRIDRMDEGARDRWRRGTVGFVFQDFHLIDELPALDNVLLPARFSAFSLPAGARSRAAELLARVGVKNGKSRLGSLSRGERQRVAVARALFARPQLILADEPTASLDDENAGAVADLLVETARETRASLLVASHDARLLARMDARRVLVGGRLAQEAT